MQTQFEFASGSVQGRDHRIVGRNNQDALHLRHLDNISFGIVADGCGSSRHSEVGAHLMSLLLVPAIERELRDPDPEFKIFSTSQDPPVFWDHVRNEVIPIMTNLTHDCPKPYATTAIEYLLCTCLCVVVTPQLTHFASIGDGVLIVNGEHFPLGPFPNNEPPYLAYVLTRTSMTSEELFFRILTFPTDHVNQFLLGTDGVLDLMRAQDRKIPHTTKHELVGPISQFWTEDRYFKNSDAVRRRLTLINRDVTIPDWEQRLLVTESGHLPDDTSFIVGRRRSPLA